jgi:hypothetical protein
MNQYTEVLYYIKGLAQADDYVNTVTRGEFDKLDLNKGNIFPLVHINIASAGFTNGSTITFDVQVGCLDIRDINKEVVEDKFWEQDNEVDNLNETLACLNRIWTIMYRDFNDVGITASESPTLEPMIMADKNLLDGWIIDFTIEVPNTMLNLCND